MGTTSDRNDPRLGYGSDTSPVPQNEVYLVMSEEDRRRGFVRPVRRSYRHQDPECGAVTTMGTALAETYAANPGYYGSTYCCACQMHPTGTKLFLRLFWPGPKPYRSEHLKYPPPPGRSQKHGSSH